LLITEPVVVMKIQRAYVSDAEHILELQKTSFKSEAELYCNHSIPPMTQTLQEMQDDFLFKEFFKATEGDKIIGSVRGFEKDGTCHVGRLMVHPYFQNQGIGTKLMQEIENLFDTCKRFELFAGSKSKKISCCTKGLATRHSRLKKSMKMYL
jgi:predicted N-acetyltransferase YhbS